MTRQEIARLVCKTLALLFGGYAVIYIFAVLGNSFYFLVSLDRFKYELSDFLMALSMFIPFVAIATVAAVLWTSPDWITSRMVSPDPSAVTALKISTSEVTSIVFSVCGVVVFISGISEMSSYVANTLYVNSRNDNFFMGEIFLEALAKIAIGLWLVIGSRGIVGMIHRYRTWGLDKQAHSEEASETS